MQWGTSAARRSSAGLRYMPPMGPQPPVNPLVWAALAAGVLFLMTRKKKGAAAPANGG